MALKPTTEGMKEAASQLMEPEEELVTVGWASEKGVKYYYVALTSRRLLIIKLSAMYKVKSAESIPIEDLEGVSIYEGYKYATPDVQLISRLAETSLYVKTKAGKKRAFRFPKILGLDNKQVAVDIMESLKIGG
jgi:hypothetical protein